MHFLSSLDGKTIVGIIVVIGAILLLIKGMNTPARNQGGQQGGNNGNNGGYNNKIGRAHV